MKYLQQKNSVYIVSSIKFVFETRTYTLELNLLKNTYKMFQIFNCDKTFVYTLTVLDAMVHLYLV